MGPSTYVAPIVQEIMKKITNYGVDAGWGSIFYCSTYKALLPNFSIIMGGYVFELTPDDYVIVVGSDTCALCIQ